MHRSADEWKGVYQGKGAYFFHDRNPQRPHPLLTSLNHSDGFFNSRLVIADEALLREAAEDLLEAFIRKRGNIEEIDCVVGPATGATKLAEYLSDAIGQARGRACNWASPQKRGEGKEKSFFFDDPEHTVHSKEKVLLCEDVFTTGSSVALAAEACVALGAVILRHVLVLVNRSQYAWWKGRDITALIEKLMEVWKPEDCPLCKLGSEAILAKGENWARLTAHYD